LIKKNSKLSSLPKGSSLVEKNQRKRNAFAEALKAYMFSIEGKVPVGKPYKFVRKGVKGVNDDITLSDILGYASERGFLNRDDLVIVASCRVSDDPVLLEDLKALVEMNTSDVIGIGGGYNKSNHKRSIRKNKHRLSKRLKKRKYKRTHKRKHKRTHKRKYKKTIKL